MDSIFAIVKVRAEALRQLLIRLEFSDISTRTNNCDASTSKYLSMSYCSRYGGILCFHSFKSKRQRIATTTYKPKMKMSVSILKALQVVRERTGSSLHDSVTKDRGCLSIIYEVAQEAPISPSIASNHFSIVSIQLMHFGQGLRASLQGGYAQNR